MQTSPLPTKLGKEPLIDVLFEVRFTSLVPAADLVPGLLFGTLSSNGDKVVTQRLPPADLPRAIRRQDANLRFAATVRVQWSRFAVLIGDESLAVACSMPYPGWAAFRDAIMKVVEILSKANLPFKVNRYSLKYVDLLSVGSLKEQFAAVNWSVGLGAHDLSAAPVSLRTEVRENSMIHLINVATGAEATSSNGQKRSGAVFDLDSIQLVADQELASFAGDLPLGLDALHAANKEKFFSFLTIDALNGLEPTYG